MRIIYLDILYIKYKIEIIVTYSTNPTFTKYLYRFKNDIRTILFIKKQIFYNKEKQLQ